MKKLLILLLLVVLCACQKEEREDFFIIGHDGKDFAAGFDTASLLTEADIGFHDEGILGPKDHVSGDLTYEDLPVGSYTLYNPEKKKEKAFEESFLTYLELYVDPFEELTLDGEPFPNDLKEICSEKEGEYLVHNGPYCVLKKESLKHYSTLILHGDITDLDQDRVDRIEIFIDGK